MVATPAQLAALEQAVANLEAAAGEGGARLIEAKTRFYDQLLGACGNAVVGQVLTGLHNRVTLLRRTSMTQAGRLPQSLAEIRGIYERIAARDADGAEKACIAHIRNAAEVALAVLEKQSNQER
jgi:DNA-binding GntR family transcriptional regulator